MNEDMTLDGARGLVARTTTAEVARGAFIQAGAVEYYEAAAPDERKRLNEAMWMLLDRGEAWERDLAAQFFAGIVVPDEIRRRVVDAYLARGWDSEDPSALLLSGLGRALTGEEVQALRGAYLADPALQHRLAPALLTRDADGAVWRAFATRLES